jgi:enamine deaminase RidA (YjgF/YER057c/UK114 family)
LQSRRDLPYGRSVTVETVHLDGVAPPLGHLSNATRAGNRLYLAGLVALDADGQLVGKGSIREQTLHICRSIEQACAQHGADLTAVARCLVFITDRAAYADYDAAFAEVFGSHRPARATVIADLVNPDFLVEIVSDVELPG